MELFNFNSKEEKVYKDNLNKFFELFKNHEVNYTLKYLFMNDYMPIVLNGYFDAFSDTKEENLFNNYLELYFDYVNDYLNSEKVGNLKYVENLIVILNYIEFNSEIDCYKYLYDNKISMSALKKNICQYKKIQDRSSYGIIEKYIDKLDVYLNNYKKYCENKMNEKLIFQRNSKFKDFFSLFDSMFSAGCYSNSTCYQYISQVENCNISDSKKIYSKVMNFLKKYYKYDWEKYYKIRFEENRINLFIENIDNIIKVLDLLNDNNSKFDTIDLNLLFGMSYKDFLEMCRPVYVDDSYNGDMYSINDKYINIFNERFKPQFLNFDISWDYAKRTNVTVGDRVISSSEIDMIIHLMQDRNVEARYFQSVLVKYVNGELDEYLEKYKDKKIKCL